MSWRKVNHRGWVPRIGAGWLLLGCLAPVSPLHAIINSSAPNGTVGAPYSAKLQDPFPKPSWSVGSCSGVAALPSPPGLSLGSNGVITGVPTTAGNFVICGFVWNNNDQNDSFVVSITIAPAPKGPPPPPGPTAPVITTEALTEGTVNLPYFVPLVADGRTPFEWRLAGGSLPDGLSLSTGGLISGRPQRDGTFQPLIEVMDGTSLAGRKQFTIFIRPPVSIENACPLPNGMQGSPYRQIIGAAGGRQPYQIAILNGRLPRGVTLADILLAGTPAEAGLFEFTLQAADRDQAIGTKSCSLLVAGPPQASTNELVFRGRSGGPPVTQLISVFSATAGQLAEVQPSAQTGGNWLSSSITGARTPFAAEITADPLNLAPATYLGSINLTGGSPVAVRFLVDPPLPGQLQAEPAVVQVSASRGTTSLARSLLLLNNGTGAINVSGQLEFLSGSGWVSTSPLSGIIAPGGRLRVRLDFNTANLTPGIRRARLRFRNNTAGQDLTVPILLAVSSGDPLLQLSQSAISFRARAGGRGVPSQTFHVLAVGSSGLNWTAAAAVDPGLPQWLSLSRTSGSSAPNNPTAVDVTVNAAGLIPGPHLGQVLVQAPVENSPRLLLVGLMVEPASNKPALEVAPAGLTFVQLAGQSIPARQQLMVHNFGSEPFRAEFQLQGDSRIWSVTPPADLNIPAEGSALFSVAVNTAGVAAGVYRTALSFRAANAMDVQTVDLLLIVTGGPRTAADDQSRQAAIACPPGGLQVSSMRQALGFTTPAGAPLAVETRVTGNDGQPLRQGQVVASMVGSVGTVTALTHIESDPGRWSGTVAVPSSANPSVALQLIASDPSGGLTGCLELTGSVDPSSAPNIATGGVLSTASFDVGAPVAPGGMVAIFGSGLADGSTSATSLPLPTLLGSTRASVAGRPAPLIFAGPGQVNAILPYSLAPNVSLQLVLRRGALFGLAEMVTAPAQPGVFAVNVRGTGQAIAVLAANQLLLADTANPVAPGEGLVIYCEGLGELDNPLEAGAQTPPSPLRRPVLPVRVTIGGVEAQVVFAGLTPGLSGLHQINVVVPVSVQTGFEVPVEVTAGEQSAPVVTIAVQRR